MPTPNEIASIEEPFVNVTVLTPTEWRRAAVSLGASIAIDPHEGLQRCRAVLANDALRGLDIDTGCSDRCHTTTRSTS